MEEGERNDENLQENEKEEDKYEKKEIGKGGREEDQHLKRKIAFNKSEHLLNIKKPKITRECNRYFLSANSILNRSMPDILYS